MPMDTISKSEPSQVTKLHMKPIKDMISKQKIDITHKRKKNNDTSDMSNDEKQTHVRDKRCGAISPAGPSKKQKLDSLDSHRVATVSPFEIENLPATVWKNIRGENLEVDYGMLLDKSTSEMLFSFCEKELEYNTGMMTKVKVAGKYREIPRKQVAYGDPGLSYKFSGCTVPAKPWLPILRRVKDCVCKHTGSNFNFALINRYKDGQDYIGEHRDDEHDLVPHTAIAGLSLGQCRDLILKYADSRGKRASRNIPSVKLCLKSGSLFVMKYPTNRYWYHSVPKRARAEGVRISLTFRCMKVKP